jgi:hypothetical protein
LWSSDTLTSMTNANPLQGLSWRFWVFLSLLLASPLLFLLQLDKANQVASVLALPLAALIVVVSEVPAIRRSQRPLSWRPILVIGAIVIALLGGAGLTYAIWQNTRDIPFLFGSASNDSHDAHWTDNSFVELSIPGKPPERGHVWVVVILSNVNEATSDCELPAELEYAPILDGHDKTSVTGRPGQEVDLSLLGTVQEAKVRITLHYADGNKNCMVDLHIDKAVLHD